MVVRTHVRNFFGIVSTNVVQTLAMDRTEGLYSWMLTMVDTNHESRINSKSDFRMTELPYLYND